MISKNKLFKEFLRKQSALQRTSLKNTDFIVKCRNQWKLMSENDKILFANTLKAMVPLEPLDENSNETNPLENEVLLEEIENKIIDGLVKSKSREELMDTKFFFISFNIQCSPKHKTGTEFRPLEIGLIEYTIRDGIRMLYHQFIDCGEVPLGYTFQAMDHMQRTHKIPLKNFFISSDNYVLIGSRILEMLSDSCLDQQINDMFDKPMIVFSQKEQMSQNKGSLEWIAKKCNEMREREEHHSYDFKIKVLSASKLLSALLTAADCCRSLNWCENVITSPAFDYSLGTDCPFHEQIGCIYCALGVPKRMAYITSHILMESYDIRLSSSHLPSIIGNKNFRIKEEDEKEEKAFDFKSFKEEIDRHLVPTTEASTAELESDDGWNGVEEKARTETRRMRPAFSYRSDHRFRGPNRGRGGGRAQPFNY